MPQSLGCRRKQQSDGAKESEENGSFVVSWVSADLFEYFLETRFVAERIEIRIVFEPLR